MKVLHLPTYAGNHGYSMSLAERKAGIDSTSMIVGNNKFNFKADEHITYKNNIENFACRLNAFYSNRKKYDVYHFNYGQSLLDWPGYGLHLLDLPFYNNVKICTFNGSDVRQLVSKDVNEYTIFNKDEPKSHGLSYETKRKRNAKIFKNVDHIFALNPDLLRFLPEEKSSFLPYVKYVWYNYMKFDYKQNKELVIVHAPTNRDVKGSDIIIKGINELKKKYLFKFILVENKSHGEALSIYKQADLIIDQIRIGWYGGFAIETMKMGKPVAVYLNEADLKYIPVEMKSALLESVINVNPDNFVEKLSIILENRDDLNIYAKNCFNYVNDFHNPDIIIKNVIEIYNSFM